MATSFTDCRNNYESEIGSFAGAKPLDTNTFRDSWEKLDELLDGVDKDTPILTYCTGGTLLLLNKSVSQ